jgi:hypothetical protein
MLTEILGFALSALLGGGAVSLYRRTLGRPKQQRAHASYKQLLRRREKLTERINAAKAEAMKGRI